jgi:medium-chain acyl-[acyl-carrier-protein] hydrolase
MRLFCFPYAGGGAAIYRSWGDYLPSSIEVCPVQLPGRGSRLKEPPYTDVPAMVEAISDGLSAHFDKPFAFFGHSMGALIGFGLARLLKEKHGLEPRHLFVSAHGAPYILDTSPPSFNLPKDEFIAELRRLKGTPEQVLAHAELMELMIPLLRADFQVCQTYTYSNANGPALGCPITAFGGTQDQHVTRETLEGWAEVTTGSFMLRMILGDHFFLHASEGIILQIVAREMYQIVTGLP